MANNVQIQTLSIRHEAILDYLLANPNYKLGSVAAYFQVSQAWLSVIIHSDAFQAKLKERTEEIFSTTVMPLRSKILGIAHVGVEKLGETLEHSSALTDKDFIVSTTDMLLKNLGFTPKGGPSAASLSAPGVQNNFFFQADKEDLEAARARMRTLTVPSTPLVLTHEAVQNDNATITNPSSIEGSKG